MDSQNSGTWMMIAMMAMCAVPLLLFAVIPAIGTIPGIAVAVAALAGMMFLHTKMMRPGTAISERGEAER